MTCCAAKQLVLIVVGCTEQISFNETKFIHGGIQTLDLTIYVNIHTHIHTQSHRHAAHLENEVNKLCEEIKQGQSSGAITYKAANKMITDMESVSSIEQRKYNRTSCNKAHYSMNIRHYSVNIMSIS